ncbi:phage protein NinX family protein [Pantoea endophytica]|nr:phage protein NinX family protein [Pantoea endophytica]
MDYSKLTDFEINKRVLAIKSGMKPLNYAHNADNRSAGMVDVNKNYHWFDFCNDWASAGPIIQRSAISLQSPESAGTEEWFAQSWRWNQPSIECYDANPRRAAMIVFLKMQEKTDAA